MSRQQTVLTITFFLGLAGVCRAEGGSIWEQETITNGFWGLNDQLEDSGIELGFELTSIYQINARGGISTNERRGRHHGRYEATIGVDLERLLGIEDGSFFVVGWGGWPDTKGIDEHSVGSTWGINALPYGNRGMDILECAYEGPLFSDNLTIVAGKLDFTAIFDATAYADNECGEYGQFLNAALVDDPTIPFPQQGLGMVLAWDITDLWYLMGGVADAQADSRETGFRTTFHKQDYFFYALETGITTQLDSVNGPMEGTYRIGLWNDPQPKANADLAAAGKSYRDDIGFYTSCDQMLGKENDDPEDSQGLGMFFRYGYAAARKNDITNFFSVGFQYQGLLEGRDDDVLGAASACGFFSDTADSSYQEDYESALEIYYNAQVTPWFNLSPSVQYIANPGGVQTAKDAVVFGIRAHMMF
jgi:porin